MNLGAAFMQSQAMVAVGICASPNTLAFVPGIIMGPTSMGFGPHASPLQR